MLVNITFSKTIFIMCFVLHSALSLLDLYALFVAHLVILVEQVFKAALVELVESGLLVVDPWKDHYNYFLPIH